jgi:hypothetical protein
MSQRTGIESHYIKDGYLYIKRWKEDTYNYVVATVTNNGKSEELNKNVIAYDYFYQNRPIIHEVYKKFGAIYRGMSKEDDRERDPTYRWRKDSVKMMLTKDLLQT